MGVPLMYEQELGQAVDREGEDSGEELTLRPKSRLKGLPVLQSVQ